FFAGACERKSPGENAGGRTGTAAGAPLCGVRSARRPRPCDRSRDSGPLNIAGNADASRISKQEEFLSFPLAALIKTMRAVVRARVTRQSNFLKIRLQIGSAGTVTIVDPAAIIAIAIDRAGDGSTISAVQAVAICRMRREDNGL